MSGKRSLEGLLLVDKPVGPSSHDMVQRVRQSLRMRKVGHTGTLDPFASGLLLLLLGRATRLSEYFHGFPKEYVATARLGVATVTDDVEGEVIATSERWSGLNATKVSASLRSFEGEIEQVPPVYSAKKVGGTTAYRRARRGEDVSLVSTSVTVHEMRLEAFDPPHVTFRVRCSTGTYVRALARDLGDRLEVGAHLTRLRRVAIGPFRVEDAIAPEVLDRHAELEDVLIPPLDALVDLPRVEVSAEEAALLETGRAVPAPPDPTGGERGEAGAEYAMAMGSRLVAVAVREGDRLRPRKVFASKASHA